jgi:hypothetical protein
MQLADLDARFLRLNDLGAMEFVPSVDEAQGLHMRCPKCHTDASNGRMFNHRCICWFADSQVPFSQVPEAEQQVVSGRSLGELTLSGIGPIVLRANCKACFEVVRGEVRLVE